MMYCMVLTKLFNDINNDVQDLSDVVSRSDFMALQQAHQSLTSLYDQPQSERLPNRSFLYLNDGLLMWSYVQHNNNDYEQHEQLVVRAVLRTKLLSLAHYVPTAAHLGITKTKLWLSKHFCIVESL